MKLPYKGPPAQCWSHLSGWPWAVGRASEVAHLENRSAHAFGIAGLYDQPRLAWYEEWPQTIRKGPGRPPELRLKDDQGCRDWSWPGSDQCLERRRCQNRKFHQWERRWSRSSGNLWEDSRRSGEWRSQPVEAEMKRRCQTRTTKSKTTEKIETR